MDQAFVKNAADKEQVHAAVKKEKQKIDQETNDVRFILNSKEGRRFVWRLLSHCRVFGSVWESSARIHYNSGMQDVGHFILANVNDASPEAFLLMMKENKGE